MWTLTSGYSERPVSCWCVKAQESVIMDTHTCTFMAVGEVNSLEQQTACRNVPASTERRTAEDIFTELTRTARLEVVQLYIKPSIILLGFDLNLQSSPHIIIV